MLIGLLFNKVLETIIFLVTYIPMRIYAGGYHAKTHIRCYICSVALIVAVLLSIEFIPWTNFIVINISTISGLIIYILSPVGDINKPLDAAEVKLYGKKLRIILKLEYSTLIFLTAFGAKSVVVSMAISFLTLSFMLVIEKLKILN